jgi:hypothetical protein
VEYRQDIFWGINTTKAATKTPVTDLYPLLLSVQNSQANADKNLHNTDFLRQRLDGIYSHTRQTPVTRQKLCRSWRANLDELF